MQLIQTENYYDNLIKSIFQQIKSCLSTFLQIILSAFEIGIFFLFYVLDKCFIQSSSSNKKSTEKLRGILIILYTNLLEKDTKITSMNLGCSSLNLHLMSYTTFIYFYKIYNTVSSSVQFKFDPEHSPINSCNY